jgi:hypothetical protein
VRAMGHILMGPAPLDSPSPTTGRPAPPSPSRRGIPTRQQRNALRYVDRPALRCRSLRGPLLVSEGASTYSLRIPSADEARQAETVRAR